MKKIISGIFYVVMIALRKLATCFGITYNAINIIVYYMLIPLSWTIMLDIYIQYPLFTYTLVVVWIGIMIGIRGKFITWSDWAFKKSVDFLNYFNRWGGNYVLNSVVICVVVPIAIYTALILLLI